jgi:YfiH family protein
MIEHSLLSAKPVRHCFFTRAGGVSTGLYWSLNCGLGSGDAADRVRENRARCAASINTLPDRLMTVRQVHGAKVVEATGPWDDGGRPEADAMVTRCPGLALGILTADCAPVLLADREAGVIGAAHAGWKGAKASVIEATVAAMIGLGGAAERIVAVVGPTIGAASYEVGPEFRTQFLESDPESGRFFTSGATDRPHFDLQGFVLARLSTLGLAEIARIDADTCAESDRFFSYRRSCLLGEPDYGRQLSAIALT